MRMNTETHRSKNIIDVIQILKINCVRYASIYQECIRRAKKKMVKNIKFYLPF